MGRKGGTRTPIDESSAAKINFLVEKGGSEGRFWDPLKIENGSKTELLRIDRHLGPLKMLSGSGPGKNMKINEKPVEQ